MSQWAREHPDQSYDDHFGLPRREPRPVYGSRDIELASPAEYLPDTAPCRCGHTLDDHTHGICTAPDMSRPQFGGIYAHELCACNDFQLDEDDLPPGAQMRIDRAIDEARGK